MRVGTIVKCAVRLQTLCLSLGENTSITTGSLPRGKEKAERSLRQRVQFWYCGLEVPAESLGPAVSGERFSAMACAIFRIICYA